MWALRIIPIALLLAPLFACGGGSSGAPPSPAPGPVNFRVESVTAAAFPVRLAFAPDGRLFFNELQSGNVRILQNGSVLAQPFVSLNVATHGELGLLGIALDPNFPGNRFVYLYYSDPSGVHKLVRYRESNNVGVDAAVLVDNLPLAGNHNGGNIGFGPDGKLYLSIGDNQDPANSQNEDSVSGKILLFNPDGTIPADNPFGVSNPVFALGLRNSFDFTFHPQSGAMYASENGPQCDDEINRVLAGGNYGWRPSYPCGDTSAGFSAPVLRINPVIAPTGVLFYTGTTFPQWRNTLFLVDFNTGSMQNFVVNDTAPGSIVSTQQVDVGQHGALLDIAQAPDGTIYFSSDVGIFRIIPE